MLESEGKTTIHPYTYHYIKLSRYPDWLIQRWYDEGILNLDDLERIGIIKNAN